MKFVVLYMKYLDCANTLDLNEIILMRSCVKFLTSSISIKYRRKNHYHLSLIVIKVKIYF